MTRLGRPCGLVLAFSFVLALLAGVMPVAAQAQVERVIGGKPAPSGKWLFQASLLIDKPKRNGKAICGGALIAANWVLTAAHCLVDAEDGAVSAAANVHVRLGSTNRSIGGEEHSVRRVIPHADYDPRHIVNDIALLELDRASSLPIVTAEATTSGASSRVIKAQASPWAVVIGWGLTDPRAKAAVEELQEASLPIIDNDRCNASLSENLRPEGPIDDRRLCAGQSEGGIDSCNGDSGGPLLVQGSGNGWVQVGIVSYGERDCGKPNSYGVYTRVASFAPWITRTIGAPSPSPSPVQPIGLGATSSAPTIIDKASQQRGRIALAMSKRDLRIGDRFELAVASDFDGYLALFDINEKNEVTLLFPNPRSAIANKDGSVRAGAPLRLPDSTYGFALQAAEPRGRGRVLAFVVSDRAKLADLSSSMGFRALNDANARFAELERAVTSPSSAGSAPLRWGAALIDYIVQ